MNCSAWPLLHVQKTLSSSTMQEEFEKFHPLVTGRALQPQLHPAMGIRDLPWQLAPLSNFWQQLLPPVNFHVPFPTDGLCPPQTKKKPRAFVVSPGSPREPSHCITSIPSPPCLCAGASTQEGMPWPITTRFGAQHVFPGLLCTAAEPVGILLDALGYQDHQKPSNPAPPRYYLADLTLLQARQGPHSHHTKQSNFH